MLNSIQCHWNKGNWSFLYFRLFGLQCHTSRLYVRHTHYKNQIYMIIKRPLYLYVICWANESQRSFSPVIAPVSFSLMKFFESRLAHPFLKTNNNDRIKNYSKMCLKFLNVSFRSIRTFWTLFKLQTFLFPRRHFSKSINFYLFTTCWECTPKNFRYEILANTNASCTIFHNLVLTYIA